MLGDLLAVLCAIGVIVFVAIGVAAGAVVLAAEWRLFWVLVTPG